MDLSLGIGRDRGGICNRYRVLFLFGHRRGRYVGLSTRMRLLELLICLGCNCVLISSVIVRRKRMGVGLLGDLVTKQKIPKTWNRRNGIAFACGNRRW